MRKLPLVGRVATEKDFDDLEARMQEANDVAAADIRLIRRQLEDIGWDENGHPRNIGLSDLTQSRREVIVRRAVRYWVEDPLVGEAVDLHTNYVFGKGMEVPKFENPAAQSVINDFWANNDNKLVLTTHDAQTQKSNELQLQGNVFFALFIDNDSGEVVMSDLIFAEVKDIICHPENRKKHLFYKRVIEPLEYDFKQAQYIPNSGQNRKIVFHADWENWPLEQTDDYAGKFGPDSIAEGVIYHVSINRLSDGKFGNPSVARIIDWAKAYNNFMRARVSLMEAASWLAWRRKVKGDPNTIRKMAADFSQSRFDQQGLANPTGVDPAPGPARYAATITENENTSLDFVKADTNSVGAKHDGDMLKAQIGAGAGFPVHYFGDASSGGNLATATAMELPVLKMCEAAQEKWEGVFRNIVDKVLETAIRAGNLPKPANGKFSDIETDAVKEAHGSMREAGFSNAAIQEAIEKHGSKVLLDVKEAGGGGAAATQIGTGAPAPDPDVDLGMLPGDDMYAYALAMPAILQRQLSDTINSVVNMVLTLDPNGANDELARWCFDFCLETLNVTNAQEVTERVFPKGQPINRGSVPERGPMRVIDRQPSRASAAKTTGAPTRAWTSQDHANAGNQAGVAKEAGSGDDFDLLNEIKAEFETEYNAIYNTLTDDLLAAALGDTNASGSAGTK